MKRHHLISITAIWLSVALTLNAQISLQRNYAHSVYYTELSPGEYKLFLMDLALSECRIYNLDHSLYKTIKINLDTDYYLYDISYVTRNVFNNDNQIELLYVARRYFGDATPSYFQYMLEVINEEGNSLLKVDQGTYYEIQHVNGENKLLVWLYDNSTFPYFSGTNIYSLPAAATGSIGRKSGKAYPHAYPNPSSDQVTIPFTLSDDTYRGSVRIYSAGGQLMNEFPVDNSFGNLLLDVSDLSPGIYYYSVITNGKKLIDSKKFIVTK